MLASILCDNSKHKIKSQVELDLYEPTLVYQQDDCNICCLISVTYDFVVLGEFLQR